ncbi:MAG: PRC-barrel domain-containing protein [Bacteroidota bacterium]|nr:PRC-barrel domain-containing protein [Bacteroidota bacterium]
MKKDSKDDDKIYRLYRMDELDKYEVSDKDTDVRGYILLGGDGERLGKIDELIVDPEIGKVRYLDVKLDADLVVVDDNRHLLLPIGVAVLDEDHDNIIVRSLNRSNIKFYPPYRGEPITREYEQKIRDSHRFTMLNNDVTARQEPKHEPSSNQKSQAEPSNSDTFRDEGFQYIKSRQNIEESQPIEDQGRSSKNQNTESDLEALRKERDIARAERDILKVQLEQAKKVIKDDFYDHEDFDDKKFYENRRKNSRE